jgi:hypothetical protein
VNPRRKIHDLGHTLESKLAQRYCVKRRLLGVSRLACKAFIFRILSERIDQLPAPVGKMRRARDLGDFASVWEKFEKDFPPPYEACISRY